MTGPRLQPRLVIFDLDGVIYRGERAVPGAAGLVAALRRGGRVVRFATNNSMATRDEYVTRLAGHGIPAAADEIVTSASATIEHLRRHLPDVRRVLVVGAAGLVAELRAAGYQATPAAEAAPPGWAGDRLGEAYDGVVVGLDPQLDYRRLGIAMTAIRAGARFVATNADARYPLPNGLAPGAGSIVAALTVACGQPPLVVGKPEPAMFRTILERAAVRPEEALVIGDNPDSDMPAARRAGIASVLVLSGVADAAMAATLAGERRPDHVVADPAGVAELLGVSAG